MAYLRLDFMAVGVGDNKARPVTAMSIKRGASSGSGLSFL